MSQKTTLKMISQIPHTTSASLNGNLNRWNFSALTKREQSSICSTDVNPFPGTENLVIDGEWKSFNVRTIINSLHIVPSWGNLVHLEMPNACKRGQQISE
jgi:hypothetical protein